MDELFDYDEIVELLAKTNRHDYNTLKLCEELTELQENLLKSHLKVPEKKPSQEQIVEEIGDVLVRIMIYMEQNDILTPVEARMQHKLTKLKSYYEQGKYKGGI